MDFKSKSLIFCLAEASMHTTNSNATDWRTQSGWKWRKNNLHWYIFFPFLFAFVIKAMFLLLFYEHVVTMRIINGNTDTFFYFNGTNNDVWINIVSKLKRKKTNDDDDSSSNVEHNSLWLLCVEIIPEANARIRHNCWDETNEHAEKLQTYGKKEKESEIERK